MPITLVLDNTRYQKCAYIIEGNWSFVILTRLAQHKYQYSISKNYDSTDLDKLINIYKSLLFVKQEIFA